MPILAYFAAVGLALVAVLFVADATLDKHGPMPFNNESFGLPKKWRAEAPTSSIVTLLTTTPAPAPDMNSPEVLAAAPPALPVVAAASRAEAAPQRTAKVEAPKKPKRIVRKQPYHDRQHYAWRQGNPPFGGLFFGRF